MGFATQMIFLYLWAFFAAKVYSDKLRKKNKDWIAFLAMIGLGGTLLWGILVYLEVIPIATLVNWIPWVNVTSGKEWMWNSFQVFGLQPMITYQKGLDFMAVWIFLSYPAIYHWGHSMGQMTFGRKTYEKGYWWALQPIKKPKKTESNQ